MRARAAVLEVEAAAYRRMAEETPDPVTGDAAADVLGETVLYARLWLRAQFQEK